MKKRFVIVWLPSTGMEPTVFEAEGKAGYVENTDSDGNPTSYKLWFETQTVLVPASNVAFVKVDFPPREQ